MRTLTTLLACLTALAACTGTTGPTRPGPGPMEESPFRPAGGCNGEDTDGDGIADAWEQTDEIDMDGLVGAADDDHDNDGIPDAMESGDQPCSPPDTDSDLIPDFLDTDSDNDGLSDAEELAAGTNPRNGDSDGDGISDFGEVAGTGTDPNDAGDTISPDDFFVVLPYLGPQENRPLRFGTNINLADVYFLADMAGSMQGERSNLISGLQSTIIPGIAAEIDNVQFGAGGMDDYPISGVGGGRDLPYYNLRNIGPHDDDNFGWSITSSASMCPRGGSNDIGMLTGSGNGTPDLLEAVAGLPCHSGGDGPESYIPALWSTATGSGLTWAGGSVPDQVCPMVLDREGTAVGYPCFRAGALPIILLFGDFSFHNGPGDSEPYSFDTPTYAETVDALNAIGARVIGIYSNTNATYRQDYEAIARDTGTVDGAGQPLVFDIAQDGSGLDATVVNAVASLVGGTPQDVSTTTENVPGNPDETDATLFIKAITPVQGYSEAGVAGEGFDSMDATTFYHVIPGTQVEFDVTFENDFRNPATPEIHKANIVVLGNGVARLDQRAVFIYISLAGYVPPLI